MLLHAALWLTFARARRGLPAQRWPIAAILIPAPVFLYCAGGLCWLALASSRLSGVTVGSLLGVAWVALAIACAWWVRRPVRSAWNSHAVLDFAGAANLSAILLLPLQQQAEQSALAETAFHWRTSVLALAATAGLIGASFLYHRTRRAP
jgi:hypothetical protein